MNRARFQTGKDKLTIWLHFFVMNFLSGIVDLGLFLGRSDVIQHPLPRCVAPSWIFEVQINDDLKAARKNLFDRFRSRRFLEGEAVVCRSKPPDNGAVQPGKTIRVLGLQVSDGLLFYRGHQRVMTRLLGASVLRPIV